MKLGRINAEVIKVTMVNICSGATNLIKGREMQIKQDVCTPTRSLEEVELASIIQADSWILALVLANEDEINVIYTYMLIHFTAYSWFHSQLVSRDLVQEVWWREMNVNREPHRDTNSAFCLFYLNISQEQAVLCSWVWWEWQFGVCRGLRRIFCNSGSDNVNQESVVRRRCPCLVYV